MITIGATPKAFLGHIGVIQENAIKSWLTNIIDGERTKVILFGDEIGTKEMCKKYQLKHCPKIKKNKLGTPILSDIFKKFNEVATTQIICYVSADAMMFFKEFSLKINGPFFITGKRFDVNITEPIDFSKTIYLGDYKLKPHKLTACEYWMFPRGLITRFPPFLVGRGGMDNYLVWMMQRDGVPVINCSPKNILIVHQNHDYSHIKDAKSGWKGKEAKENFKLTGWFKFRDLRDADYLLQDGELKEAPITPYIMLVGNPIGRFLLGIKRFIQWNLKP